MRVRVLAFARVAELLGWSARDCDVASPFATTATLWQDLVRDKPDLAALADSTRVARNGRVVHDSEVLNEGDEIALLPPAGGG